MPSGTDISALYQEFTEALTEKFWRRIRLVPLGADGLLGLTLPLKNIPSVPN